MKHVTPSDARKNWFRLLDEVASGETVVIERNGRRILIQRAPSRVAETAPAYSAVLKAAGRAEHADEWTWEWNPSRKALRPATRSRK
jgi:antitoxin (DNA-binding transcriptional repressor) of toxin-antitoxin stability system